MKYFTAIAAMTQDRVIGNGDAIPWKIKEELAWFKRVTMGHALVMGRKTYESIGKPLPGRDTLVLSRAGRCGLPETPNGVKVITCLECVNPNDTCKTVFICGGEQIYRQALPYCLDLYLTIVHRSYEGDKFFPKFEHLFKRVETVGKFDEFTIYHYRNLAPRNPPRLQGTGS